MPSSRPTPCPNPRNAFPTLLRSLVAFAVLAAGANPVFAGTHEKQQGGYRLQAHSFMADSISDEKAREYRIKRRAHTALVNVVVLRAGDATETPVKADVKVHATNLAGMMSKVRMRETEAAGRVAYLGTYRFGGRDTVKFDVTAKPEGSSEPITLQFEEQYSAP